MDNCRNKRLHILAARIRLLALEGTCCAKSGHPGGSLSAADALCALYFEQMRIDPRHPDDPNRDRFVLSKGHAAPAYYAALALRGYFPTEELRSLRHTGALLQGHPDMKTVPGVDMSTGSLGQGFSAAAGMALAGKLNGAGYRVYTLLGDGELEEGQVWEAAMFAAHKRLNNLCVLIDNNGLQIDGKLEEVNSPYPIAEKFQAFGFETVEIDGHDFAQLESAFHAAEKSEKPFAAVMKTVKGKGVSFMENRAEWHGVAPNREQFEAAQAQLNAEIARWEKEA